MNATEIPRMIAATKIRTDVRWDHLAKVFAERMKRAAEDQGSYTVAPRRVGER